ncbi:hypothetical protein Ciccas_001796 [Cichlidogyrus casuarinus]|uniref:BTB domain-containing protein n=1 Tax=Cichlidogyrus casuarinus TaxID=1844966 RepID=A0ABD2QJ18_9PLAT
MDIGFVEVWDEEEPSHLYRQEPQYRPESTKETSKIDQLLNIAQQYNVQNEKDALNNILQDDILIKLLDTEIYCEDSPEPIKAPYFVLALNSEYFRLAFQYTHSKTEKPYKIHIPGISRSALQKIVDLILEKKELDLDDDMFSELLITSSFLLIPKLELALVEKLQTKLPTLGPETHIDLVKSAIDFYQKTKIAEEILKELFLYYFSKHSTSHELILMLGQAFVADLLKNGCPLFIPHDSKETEIKIPIHGYFKEERKKFLEFLPFKPELDENDTKVFNGVPDALCEHSYLSYGRHSSFEAEFQEITEKLSTCTVSPKEYRLSAITAYLNRGWNSSEDIDYVEGLVAEYEHIVTGQIVVVTPWNGFGNHGATRRIEIPKNESITSIQINHGWLIDHIAFTTSSGRNLGQLGTSDGGNVSSINLRNDEGEFLLIKDGTYPRNTPMRISPVTLFGFTYRMISSANMPFMNRLKFVFTAFNAEVEDKLVQYHGADDREHLTYLEVAPCP